MFFTILTSSYRNEHYKHTKSGAPSVIRSTRGGRQNAIEQYRGQTERCNQRSVHIVLLFLFSLFLTNSALNYRCYKTFVDGIDVIVEEDEELDVADDLNDGDGIIFPFSPSFFPDFDSTYFQALRSL